MEKEITPFFFKIELVGCSAPLINDKIHLQIISIIITESIRFENISYNYKLKMSRMIVIALRV